MVNTPKALFVGGYVRGGESLLPASLSPLKQRRVTERFWVIPSDQTPDCATMDAEALDVGSLRLISGHHPGCPRNYVNG